MKKSISLVAAFASALCFATMAYAAGQKGPKSDEDDAPNRCRRCKRIFRSIKRGRSRTSTASRCPPEWTSA